MANLNFPANPTVGDTYTPEGLFVIYTWNGEYWEANSVNSFDSRFVELNGDNMTGDLTLGGDKITLDAGAGSAQFASTVKAENIDGLTYNFDVQRQGENLGGFFADSDGSYCYLKPTGGGNAKIELNGGDGSATFAGDLEALNVISNAALVANENRQLSTSFPSIAVRPIGTGDDVIQMFSDGSATFGLYPASTNIGSDSLTKYNSSTAGNIICRKTDSFYDDNHAFQVQNSSGTVKASITGNGSASFLGPVSVTRTSDSQSCFEGYKTGSGATTSKITANGSATFAGDVTLNSNLVVKNGDNGGVYIYGSDNTIKTRLDGDGSATFESDVTANNYVVKWSDGEGDSRVWRCYYNGTGSGNITSSITASGAATFTTVNGASVFIQLEADDDTKYTATTNEEGEETLVYNGAVLDVKERLQKTHAALGALKTAAAAAVDFAALKSAIATALADI